MPLSYWHYLEAGVHYWGEKRFSLICGYFRHAIAAFAATPMNESWGYIVVRLGEAIAFFFFIAIYRLCCYWYAYYAGACLLIEYTFSSIIITASCAHDDFLHREYLPDSSIVTHRFVAQRRWWYFLLDIIGCARQVVRSVVAFSYDDFPIDFLSFLHIDILLISFLLHFLLPLRRLFLFIRISYYQILPDYFLDIKYLSLPLSSSFSIIYRHTIDAVLFTFLLLDYAAHYLYIWYYWWHFHFFIFQFHFPFYMILRDISITDISSQLFSSFSLMPIRYMIFLRWHGFYFLLLHIVTLFRWYFLFRLPLSLPLFSPFSFSIDWSGCCQYHY